MASSPVSSSLLAVIVVLCFVPGTAGSGANPTARFVKVELTNGSFEVQSPYNVPESQRYQNSLRVRQFWVLHTDKPFNTTHTKPRTEDGLRGHDYSSGVWQFQGYGYVPSGTSVVSVMQIHCKESVERSTVLMLHVFHGVLRFYSGQAVEGNIYSCWFQLNVVHDADRSTVAVYADGHKRFATDVPPRRSYYFKFGVYMQHHDQSPCMESGWTNVTVYTKA